MKMPERDPGLIAAAISAFTAMQAFFYAGLVAAVRVLRDERTPAWKRIALEALMCGLLAQGLDSAARYFFGWHVPTFIAACVGLLGPEWIRMKMKKKADRVLNDENNGE